MLALRNKARLSSGGPRLVSFVLRLKVLPLCLTLGSNPEYAMSLLLLGNRLMSPISAKILVAVVGPMPTILWINLKSLGSTSIAAMLLRSLASWSRAAVAGINSSVMSLLAPSAVRVSDLDRLVLAARGAQDVRHFVSELVLDPPASSADLAGPPHLDEDYLVLSTVHSAKGLEWDAVHLIAAYDGNFPADMCTGTEEGIAEERRLFYVALTRPRRRLHVYVPSRFYYRPNARDDAHGMGQASRFLTETVQGLFSVTCRADGRGAGAAAELPGHRIEVSVDALFG